MRMNINQGQLLQRVGLQSRPILRAALAVASVAFLNSCGGGSRPPAYSISGNVTGLASGASLVLVNNGGNPIAITSNSSFMFSTRITTGEAYDVTIETQPPYQGCSVRGGTGTVANMDVSNVQIDCPLVTQIKDFGYGEDADYPQSGMIAASDGTFFGTSEYGGSTAQGAIYHVNSQGVESLYASFGEAPASAGPCGQLLQVADGSFYGTTYWGGTNNSGSVFHLTTDTVIHTVWSFGSGSDGSYPVTNLILGSDGNLYGTTGSGGTSGYGTFFRLTLDGTETVLWNFGIGPDGSEPGNLVDGGDGFLYGTTSFGGSGGYGTVFKITLTGTETVLWKFSQDGAEGDVPGPGLTKGTDGNFYGTTQSGTNGSLGSFFKITPAGALTVVWAFHGTTGAEGPFSQVIQASDGNFYGTSGLGGTVDICDNGQGAGCGTIFKITPAGEETVLWSFGFGTNGSWSNPLGLVEAAPGIFYGVSKSGGSVGSGTLFQLQL